MFSQPNSFGYSIFISINHFWKLVAHESMHPWMEESSPPKCVTYPIGSSPQGWILSNVYRSSPQHQPISWICSSCFCSKRIQTYSPSDFWMVMLHHCYKGKQSKNIKNESFCTNSLSSIPSSHPIHHPFAGQNIPPAKFTTAILPCSPCRRNTASTAERDSRDPVLEGVGQAIGSKAQAPDFNLRRTR